MPPWSVGRWACPASSAAARARSTVSPARIVTVDGRTGKVYDGALAIEAPDESDHESLATLGGWAASRSPLRVLPPSAAGSPRRSAISHERRAAADPTTIGEALKLIKGARGARGGAIASDEGVRARSCGRT